MTCRRCEAPVEPSQEYCLECGVRLGGEHPGAAESAFHSPAERHGADRSWLLPALLGLVIAVFGTGAAIAISGNGEQAEAVQTATGGSLTVSESTSTLTAPEPATSPATTAQQAPAIAPPAPRPANPAAVIWPRDRRGWTIVLLSLPQANGRAAAAAQAAKARQGGLRRVGILDSSRYASLHPGYYVVFQGVFDSEPEASSALQRARTVFPSAYPREIVP